MEQQPAIPYKQRFIDCPYKMSDGRHFTDYRPSCLQNSPYAYALQKPDKKEYTFPPASSFAFRQYLIAHGEDFMQKDRQHAINMNFCTPTQKKTPVMVPEQTKMTCDKSSCHVTLHDPKGVGQGRNFDTQYNPSRFKYVGGPKEPKPCCTVGETGALDFYPVNDISDSIFKGVTPLAQGYPFHEF